MFSKSKQSNLLPNRQLVMRFCDDEMYIRSYYGSSWQDRLRSSIFKQKISLVLRLISQYTAKVELILDVGCGPIFIAHSLIQMFGADYVGIDIVSGQKMKKRAKIIEFSTGKKINLVRASAECLPFRERIFDVSISLDVLEHLKKPQDALNEMNRVTIGNLVISLPLENTFQKMVRFPILLSEGMLKDPTPQYHYVGSFTSYREIWEKLLRAHVIKSEYAPFGMSELFNFEVIHVIRPFGTEEHNSKNSEKAS